VTEENGENSELLPYVRAQVDYIIGEFDRKFDSQGPAIKVVPHDGGVGFMYAEGQLLVRDEYLDRVLALLEPPQEPEQGPSDDRAAQAPDGTALVEPVIRGVALVRLRQRYGRPSVLETLDRIDAAFGSGAATPNQVLTVCPEIAPCAATEPEIVDDRTEPYPGICHASSGAGVMIYIADTGLVHLPAKHHPWLRDVHGEPDAAIPVVNGTPAITSPYTGHGTFVAGVVRCMAPDAEIFVMNEMAGSGSALESDIAQRLNAALSLPVDIFHLSITAPTRNNQPMIGIEAWLELLRQYKGTVCVAPAGNSGSAQRSWPAASPGVVSVGALAADWRSRARFSNFGSWVDVYAPGRDLVNAFATGSYVCQVPPYTGQEREFYGMAKWSGTSFSSPIVTGLIAARMFRTGENGQQAAAALLAEARRQAIPGVGPILLPCCEPSRCEPPRHECCTERLAGGCACGGRR
jgi:subtilisin family serine protease